MIGGRTSVPKKESKASFRPPPLDIPWPSGAWRLANGILLYFSDFLGDASPYGHAAAWACSAGGGQASIRLNGE